MSYESAWTALDRAQDVAGELKDEALGRAIENAKDVIRARKGELTLAYTDDPWEGAHGWVWYLSQCGGVHGAIQKALALGLDGILIKEADEGRRWRQLTPAVVQDVRSAGLRVFAWTYLYGEQPERAADAVATIVEELGVDGVVVDAEAEVRDRSQAIELFCERVRYLVPDAHLGVSPLPVMTYHEGLRYELWRDYGFVYLPQFYTNVLPARWNLATLFSIWAGRIPMDEVYPVFGMYGETGYVGDSGARYPRAADLAEFWALAKRYGCRGTSYWRLDTIDIAVWLAAKE